MKLLETTNDNLSVRETFEGNIQKFRVQLYAGRRDPCPRCGGSGWLEQYRWNGGTCFACGGSGIDLRSPKTWQTIGKVECRPTIRRWRWASGGEDIAVDESEATRLAREQWPEHAHKLSHVFRVVRVGRKQKVE